MSVNAILTGQTKEPNIDLTKANVTGILPVAKGGTGNATGAIDLTKGTGILPIANGGTGASTASTALSNLGGITQATADGRYLGKTAKAADSAKLGGMTTGGKTWPFIASVAEDGVMEIGQYIDFHTKSGLTTDYDGRISLTGNAFDMGGKKLSGVGTPTAASDAATKQYVDNKVGNGNFIYLGGTGVFNVSKSSSGHGISFVSPYSPTPVTLYVNFNSAHSWNNNYSGSATMKFCAPLVLFDNKVCYTTPIYIWVNQPTTGPGNYLYFHMRATNKTTTMYYTTSEEAHGVGGAIIEESIQDNNFSAISIEFTSPNIAYKKIFILDFLGFDIF